MKKIVGSIIFLLLLTGSAFAVTDCDVWLGTWDVQKDDGSSCTWVIDQIITGTSSNIPCQAVGTSTPVGGGETTFFQIITVTFFPSFIYTEALQLGEGMDTHELLINSVGDAFESGTTFTDYNIASGTKRLSGPRCGGVAPAFVSAGATEVDVTITGRETTFDDGTTEVSFDCPEIELISADVISPTEISAVISVAEDASDTICAVIVTTGTEQIICSLEIRGIGDPERVCWEFATGGVIASSPAVYGGYVYVGSGDNNVYCLDAQTGAKIWEFTTGNVVLSSPAVLGCYVYVGSNDNKVYCLDAQTGSKIWEYETGDAVQSSPALSDGYVYVGSFDDKVYCLDAQTGSKMWEFTTGNDVFSTPAVADGRVFVGGVDFSLYCLDAISGDLLWEYVTNGDIPPSPAVVDGYVYFGSKDNYFYCLEAATGTKVWDFQTGDIVFASPAVIDGFVYFASMDDNVYCLNAEDGTLAWDFETGDVVQGSPAVTEDYVYIGSSDTNVYCLNSGTGIRIWSYKTGSTVLSAPAVSDGRVYVGSFDNSLYCLKAPEDEEGAWPMFRHNLLRTGAPLPIEQTCPLTALSEGEPAKIATLREFRDQVLARTTAGRKIIEVYYAQGKTITGLFDRSPIVAQTAKKVLDMLMPLVEGAVE